MYYYDIETNELTFTTEKLIVLKKLDTIVNSIIITEAQEEYICICQDCGEIININENTYYIYNNDCLCENCYENNYFTCEDCGNVCLLDNCRTVHKTFRNGHTYEAYVCPDCANSNYYECLDCGKYFESDCGYRGNDNDFICQSCYENGDYAICANCGCIVHYDYVYNEETCEVLCYDCADENSSVYSYDYLPDLAFHKTVEDSENTTYYGFELEVHIDKSYAYDYLSYFNTDEIFLTDDSSIVNGGFEITSHPLTYNYIFNTEFKTRFNNSLEFLKNHNGAGHNHGGLHIHISNENLTDKQLAIIATILYNYEDSPEYNAILAITQRKKENLERWSSLSISTSVSKSAFLYNVYENGKINSSKYTGLNTNHSDTLEFRIFNSSLRFDRFEKNMQFVKALLSYSKQLLMAAHYDLNNINIDDLSIFKLIKYCKRVNKRNKYTTFLKFIDEFKINNLQNSSVEIAA